MHRGQSAIKKIFEYICTTIKYFKLIFRSTCGGGGGSGSGGGGGGLVF
jgi:hypothetical protein